MQLYAKLPWAHLKGITWHNVDWIINMVRWYMLEFIITLRQFFFYNDVCPLILINDKSQLCFSDSLSLLRDGGNQCSTRNGAETNCRIAHILGILLMNSCYTDRFLATTVVYGLSTLNCFEVLSQQLSGSPCNRHSRNFLWSFFFLFIVLSQTGQTRFPSLDLISSTWMSASSCHMPPSFSLLFKRCDK